MDYTMDLFGKESYQNMIKVYEMLEDNLSKKIFLNRLLYSISESEEHIMHMIGDCYREKRNKCHANEELLILCEKICSEQKTCRIALFGGGEGAMTVLQLLYEYGMLTNPNIEVFFVDNDKNRQGTTYNHHNTAMRLPVYSPQKLDYKDENLYVLISVKNGNYHEEIYDQLICMGISDKNIFRSVPGYEYNLGNIYFEKGIMIPKKGDVFCDIGAYDMWNTEQFIRFCPEYGYVYAFEADPVSFEKCQENIIERELFHTEVFNLGIWSQESEISFESAPNGEYGGSRISKQGTSVVKTVALDNFLSDKKIDIIKMDIEGAELEALKGAKDIIERQKPCLCLSVYHKKWDVLELPLYIKSLNPGYKFYMRHHTFGIWDTVLYAIDEKQRNPV